MIRPLMPSHKLDNRQRREKRGEKRESRGGARIESKRINKRKSDTKAMSKKESRVVVEYERIISNRGSEGEPPRRKE